MAAAAPSYKLYYFPAPARAETSRLLFALGKIPFEDIRIQREQWPEFKQKTPFGQMPVLEVDGKMLAQTKAIDHYVAKQAKLYPTDDWEAALVDQYVSFISEFQEALTSIFSVKDPEEKAAAVQKVLEGPLHDKFTRLDNILASAPGGYLVGGKLSLADVNAYSLLCSLTSGFIPGLSNGLYKKYPHVEQFRSKIASIPEIQDYVSKQGDNPLWASFKP